MSRNALPAALPVSTGCSVAFQGDTSGLELVHDVLEVLERAGQTVDASNNERVAGTQKVEQHLQLGAAIAPRAAGLLGTNHLATRRR
jgi:hypothetical protein